MVLPYKAHYWPHPMWRIYPCLALRARGALSQMWIYKSYHAAWKIPNVDYPANPYRFRRGGHPGMVVTKYYYPTNPKTSFQQSWRAVFSNGLNYWSSFDNTVKGYYNEMVRGKDYTGQLKYLKLYLDANYPPSMADKVIATKLVASDGSGDYTDIQNAIDALPASGGMVFIKEGTYSISAALTIAKSNVILAGQGSSSIIFLANASDKNLLEIGDGVNTYTGITIEGLVFDGNRANQGDNAQILVNGKVNDLTFKECTIKNGYDSGIRIAGTNRRTIINECIFRDNQTCQLYISVGYWNAITNNKFYDDGLHPEIGLQLNASTDCEISNNYFFEAASMSTEWFIKLTGSVRNLVSNNFCQGADVAISVDATSENNNIAGNYIYTTEANSIFIEGKENQITGNFIISAWVNSIYINSDFNVISGNYINDSYNNGIYLSDADYNLIADNEIRDSGTATNDTYSAILLDHNTPTYCTYNYIHDNYIHDTAANKSKYGIRENHANSNYNYAWNNFIKGPVTLDISLLGANSDASDNIIL